MQQLFNPLVDKQQWLVELGFAGYTKDQQQALWDLVTRALETKIIDALLDQLNQADQQALIQYIAEPDLQAQLNTFLDKKIPKHHQLLQAVILQYKNELKRDLQRLVKHK